MDSEWNDTKHSGDYTAWVETRGRTAVYLRCIEWITFNVCPCRHLLEGNFRRSSSIAESTATICSWWCLCVLLLFCDRWGKDSYLHLFCEERSVLWLSDKKSTKWEEIKKEQFWGIDAKRSLSKNVKGAFMQTPMKGELMFMRLDPKVSKYAVEL